MSGVSIDLGGSTRHIVFTMGAVASIESVLEERMRAALLRRRGPFVVSVCAALGMQAGAERNGQREAFSPERVLNWLEKEPHKYTELERCVLEEAQTFSRAIGEIPDDEAPPGEAQAPATEESSG